MGCKTKQNKKTVPGMTIATTAVYLALRTKRRQSADGRDFGRRKNGKKTYTIRVRCQHLVHSKEKRRVLIQLFGRTRVPIHCTLHKQQFN